MKLSKQQNRICAWVCLLQVLLLSLASVSPQVHGWAFHGGLYVDKDCRVIQPCCPSSSSTSDELGSESDLPADSSDLCPVVFFDQGITFTNGFTIQLPERLVVFAPIEVEPEITWKSCLNGERHARAPPVS